MILSLQVLLQQGLSIRLAILALTRLYSRTPAPRRVLGYRGLQVGLGLGLLLIRRGGHGRLGPLAAPVVVLAEPDCAAACVVLG